MSGGENWEVCIVAATQNTHVSKYLPPHSLINSRSIEN